MIEHLALLGSIFAAGLLTAIWLRRRQQRARTIGHAFAAESRDDALPAAIWHTDAAGHCTHANMTWRTLTTANKGHWQGLEWVRAFHADDADSIREQWISAISRQQFFEADWRITSDDAAPPAWLMTRAAPLFDDEGVLLGYRCVSTDVTRAKHRETELIEMARKAEIASAERIALLADMNHELHAPMRGLVEYADRLRDPDSDDLQRADLQRADLQVIADSGRMITRMLDDIFTIARLAASKQPTAPEPVDIADLLRECTTMLEPMARARGINLGLWLDDAIPALVELDRLRIRQVIGNLVENAIKYTPTGGVDVEARVESASDGQHLLLSVIDTGIGITPENLQLILQPFYQSQETIVQGGGRAGLGLALTNQLTQMMGGRMVVHSKPDVGSNFTLRLPIRRCRIDDPAGQMAAPSPISPAGDLLKGARVLLVEDDELSRHLILALSARLGLEVTSSISGEAALAAIHQAQSDADPFDAVLMDLHLPGLDGLQTTRRLRAQGITAQALPIIALTANSRPEDIAACQRAGMQAHLGKPLTSVALARELARCLVAVRTDARGGAATPGPIASAADAGLQQRYNQRKGALFSSLRWSLEQAADRTDWRALASQLDHLAGVACKFGEPELGDASRRLEQRIKLTAEPRKCQEFLRRAWSDLERAG